MKPTTGTPQTPHISGYTETEAAGIHVFDKPGAGSWTASFGLGSGPVSFADCVDPGFFELEKEAVFRRSWLQVGRVEDVPRPGTFFTRELSFLGVSVLVVRGMDGVVRAFHNVCSHRGNRLVWDEVPGREWSGSARQFACKYHGWRFGLDGQVGYVHNAPEFFDLTVEALALPVIHCEVWAGFVFVHLGEVPSEGLREFLGPEVERLESYPFHEMTHRYTFAPIVNGNWKLLKDGFQELYHVPYLHGRASNPTGASAIDKVPSMVPFFARFGRHAMYTSAGPFGNDAVRARGTLPSNALFGADVFGPMQKPDLDVGHGVNPGAITPWGADNWQIYPNFTILLYARTYCFTFTYWPIDVDTHQAILTMHFVPPTTPREWAAIEHAMNVNFVFAAEDFNATGANHAAIASRARDTFFLNDQEVAVRHFHHMVGTDVEAYRRERTPEPTEHHEPSHDGAGRRGPAR